MLEIMVPTEGIGMFRGIENNRAGQISRLAARSLHRSPTPLEL
jgi:hypothetical protein